MRQFKNRTKMKDKSEKKHNQILEREASGKN